MSIGLTGSHRTGKTTLAKAFGEKFDMHVCLTSASHVFQTLGYSPQEDYPIDIRLDIQEAILKDFARQYKEASDVSNRAFITDRTPIDLMAYTLADISRHALSEELENRLARYVQSCLNLCNKYFSTLIVIQPGIELVADATKAPIGRAYIEHISQIVMGLTVDERVDAMHFYIPKRITDLDTRVLCVQGAVNQAQVRLMGEIEYSDGAVSIH